MDDPKACGHKVPLPVLLLVRLLERDVVLGLGLEEAVEVGVAAEDDGAVDQPHQLVQLHEAEHRPGEDQLRVQTRLVQLSMNLREVSQCPENSLTRVFSWLKAPTSTFTINNLLRHYAKGVERTIFTHCTGDN